MAQGDKLRVIQTANFMQNENRGNYGNDSVIFDTSGGIYIGTGDENPYLVAGAISLQDSSTEDIDGVDGNSVYVKFVEQTLTDDQKAQARSNIGIDVALDELGGTMIEYI